jgi:hypothetical protein
MKHFKAAFVLVLVCIASSIHAQNVNELVKWTSAQVVRYDVVAEYSGTTVVLPSSGSAAAYPTQVKDRFEIGFDWNPLEMALVGKPVFKNFPSTLPAGTPARPVSGKTCPQPRLNGAYEHFEVLEAKTGTPGSNSLQLSAKRTYPGGSLPTALEGACDIWADSPAKAETLTSSMLVPPGMYLAMPAAAGSGITVGKDGKSMTFVDKTGWTYAYTLNITK